MLFRLFKIFLHPEQLIVAWAARKLGTRLRWQQNRSDGFLSDLHGRDNRTKARAVVDADGKVHALHVTVHANMGSWLSNFSTYIPTLSGSRTLTTVYAIPTASLPFIFGLSIFFEFLFSIHILTPLIGFPILP